MYCLGVRKEKSGDDRLIDEACCSDEHLYNCGNEDSIIYQKYTQLNYSANFNLSVSLLLRDLSSTKLERTFLRVGPGVLGFDSS